MTDVCAMNEQVMIKSTDHWRHNPTPVTVILACRDAAGARTFVERLAAGVFEVVSMSGPVKKISLYFGAPVTAVTHAGVDTESVDDLKADFQRRSGCAKFRCERIRSVVHIWAVD